MLRAAYPGLSWVAPARWHVTLAFLGDLKAGERHRLAAGVAPLAAAMPAFRLRIEGSGAFPSVARPRVLWVGLADQTQQLAELALGVRSAAAQARIRLDGKPFRPHITAARARAAVAQHDVPHLLRKLTAADGAEWDVERLVLMESTLGPQPRYDQISVWRLAGSAP